jgi:hypothetical protein
MNVLQQILLTALLVFLLAGSLLGIAIGTGLLARSARAAAFLGAMNHWVSTRRVLRPVELPHEPAKAGRAMGVVLALAGGYSLFVLAAMPVARLALALRVDGSPLALIAIESAKWLLMVGCTVSVATGVMLLFFPRAWRAVEEHANRWVSSRQITVGGDDMHVPLDRLAEGHPRAAGGVILALSIVSAGATALLLLRFWSSLARF